MRTASLEVSYLPESRSPSKSAASVGTESMRNVLVWPKPPFQPCTATIIDPGFTRFRESALLSPKRIRLSTCIQFKLRSMAVTAHNEYLRPFATGALGFLLVQDTKTDILHDGDGFVEQFARFELLQKISSSILEISNTKGCTCYDWHGRTVL